MALADALSATRLGQAEAPEGTGVEHFCRCYLEPPAEADALLVVFSGHFPDAVQLGCEVPFEFMRFLGQHPLGLHVLFLRDPAMLWYLQGIEGLGSSVENLASFIDRERQRLGVHRLFTLGSSMGGYAALLFGHRLRADVVLAFGPQVYLDHATRQKLGVATYRYESSLARVEQMVHERGADRYLQLTNLLPLDVGKAYIHIGKNEAGDIEQARGFNDQPNIKFVVWPGGNHMVVKALRDEGKLLPLLRKYFGPEAEDITGAAVSSKSSSVDSREDAKALRARGNELVKAGNYVEAAELYTKALQTGDSSSHHLVLANRSLCLLKLGRPVEAWHDADAAVCLEPKYSKALYRRALCEVERNYVASALRSVASARELDPEDKALRALEAQLRKRATAEPGGPPAEAPFAGYCE